MISSLAHEISTTLSWVSGTIQLFYLIINIVIFYFIYIFIIIPAAPIGRVPDEQKLYRSLMTDYENSVRPVMNASETLTIRFLLRINQIIGLVSGIPALSNWASHLRPVYAISGADQLEHWSAEWYKRLIELIIPSMSYLSILCYGPIRSSEYWVIYPPHRTEHPTPSLSIRSRLRSSFGVGLFVVPDYFAIILETY